MKKTQLFYFQVILQQTDPGPVPLTWHNGTEPLSVDMCSLSQRSQATFISMPEISKVSDQERDQDSVGLWFYQQFLHWLNKTTSMAYPPSIH